MSIDKTSELPEFDHHIRVDMVDSLDEEVEMELDDCRLDELIAQAAIPTSEIDAERHFYFKELFRLQGELVRLQDWVVHKKLKVIVLFEGRDAAGKGGGDQAFYPAPQSACLPSCGVARSKRTGARPVVFSTLRGTFTL